MLLFIDLPNIARALVNLLYLDDRAHDRDAIIINLPAADNFNGRLVYCVAGGKGNRNNETY